MRKDKRNYAYQGSSVIFEKTTVECTSNLKLDFFKLKKKTSLKPTSKKKGFHDIVSPNFSFDYGYNERLSNGKLYILNRKRS